MSLFRNGRSNSLPFGVVIDGDVSIFVDRVYRPIIAVPGKWPRCQMELATVCDGPAMFGAKLAHTFFHEHARPSADPAVRRRLRSLVDSCATLKAELRRRSDAMDGAAADEPPPERVRTHADLIRHTFNSEAAA